MREAAFGEGFSTNALVLTEELVRTWARAGAGTGVVWPTNEVSQWLLKRFVARTPDRLAGDGPGLSGDQLGRGRRPWPACPRRLAQNQVFLSGWELLGSTTLKRVQARLWQVVVPMVVLVLASLWFAFRRPTEILLGLAVLLLSGLCLLATMAVAGWSWNLLNLMALPLMLGTGVDYSIFMQLALRRHGGDLGLVRRSIGRALLLCGGTAMAGFGSLAWSSNPGHGQPGQGLRRWHRRQHADLGVPAAGVVGGGKSEDRTPWRATEGVQSPKSTAGRSQCTSRRGGTLAPQRPQPITALPSPPSTARACGISVWPSSESCRPG